VPVPIEEVSAIGTAASPPKRRQSG
jgi:hypothetical protein